MKKTVWTFGLISGALLSVMMLATLPFMERIGFEKGEVIGYTTMVLSFLFVYFGIKSYRDNVAGGTVGFGRAFAVGASIVAISSLCYVATWEVIYYKLTPDFMTKYQAYTLEKARAKGESAAAIQKRAADMEKFGQLYRNPIVNVAITFLEPLPVGLVVTLVSAGILRRRRTAKASSLAPA
jgi:hypothetical protein